MKASIALLSELRAAKTGQVHLPVLLAYQDPGCGRRAKAALDRVLAQFPEDRFCTVDLWSFEMLEHPALQREAAECASRAAVIVLSILGDSPLPSKLRPWLEGWLNHATQPKRTLALLVDEHQRHAPAMLETLLHLYRAAERSGATLVLGFAETDAALGRAVGGRLRTAPATGFPLPPEAVRSLGGFRLSSALT